MNKSDLVNKISRKKAHIKKADIEEATDLLTTLISNALSRNNRIEIRGFGTYKISKRKARIGRNPKNSQIVQIPEKKAIKWKMSKTLFTRLNKNFTENKISDTY